MTHPVQAYYDANAELEWQRFDRHPMEFAITKRALAEHLPPAPARILDCGGGPGRYAIHLARLGYPVTLLDLSANNLALARHKAAEAGLPLADFVHGNALDLSRFADGSFEAVLLFGPLYHLTRPEERAQAICEALRVLRPGGRLFAAFITFYAPFRDAFVKGYLGEQAAQPQSVDQLAETQVASEGFTDAWFTKPGEVCPLMESFGLRTLALLAAEGIAAGHETHLRSLPTEAFEFWADFTYRYCADPSLLGAADHLLYIGASPTHTLPTNPEE